MSEWNKFNAELKRRNADARRFELSPEEEEAELERSAIEAQKYINSSWEKERQDEWAAKSPEEKARKLKEDYEDSFFVIIIDGKLYLQSGIDGALTNYNGTFIGYPSEEGVTYHEIPYDLHTHTTPYEIYDAWDQNKYGQFIISNLMNVEDDIRQFEEEYPDMEWGEPVLSEDVLHKMNANMPGEKAALMRKKKAPMPTIARKIITAPKFNNNDGSNEELEGLTKEEWVQAGKIAANELRRRQLLRMGAKSTSRGANKSIGEVPGRARTTRKRAQSFGGSRRIRRRRYKH